jgi:predicted dehydrogenase
MPPETTRRDFLAASTIAGGLALAPSLFAGQNSALKVGLVGCGGRGTGAAGDAMSTRQGPVRLVAMADVYKDRLTSAYNGLSKRHKEKVDVPEARRFLGFDAYKHAMDALKPGDVVILTTPPQFRWVHFRHAIDKGLNVFMEKPVAVDGPTCRKMLALGEESVRKNMKVGVGLMCRHCLARNDMIKRVRDGAIGDITLLRAYRLAGYTGNMPVKKKPDGVDELEYQIRHFHGFLWLSGGAYSDFLIHNIDECCWFKDAWPVEAKSNGGRHYREGWVDQNFDAYSTEFTFPDGTKLYLEGRTIPGCHQEFASYCHGTKGSGIISQSGHWPSHARLFKTHNHAEKDLIWDCGEETESPYLTEWEDLMKAIRQDKPYNEVKRGVEASLVACMGRLAAHTGQVVTRDMMLSHDHEFAPNADQLTVGGPSPLKADDKGNYPVPMPGKNKRREY